MICHHCHHVYAALAADLRALQARAVLPGLREPLYDGENVGAALAAGTAITERERVHVEGEIAGLERAIAHLTMAPLVSTPQEVTIDYRCAKCGDHSAQRITMDARRANDARACELCGAEMLREGGP